MTTNSHYISSSKSQNAEQRSTWGTVFKFNDYEGESFNKAFGEHTVRSAELDQETGLYYYGARYHAYRQAGYTPEIGIWLSVDPLSDKYPHQSPFMFCSGNPVMRVDMNGMEDDWYLNEKTGELYYNKNRSSQTTTHNNKTYTRIGDNDMMGDMGATTEKDYNYTQSQSLAQKNGYNINPTQQLEQHETKTYSDFTTSAKSSAESFTIINEKYAIFSSDAKHKVETKKELIVNDYDVLDLLFTIGGTATVDSRSRTYSTYLNNADFKKSGSKEKDNFPAGSSVIFYKSWNDYSNRTKGKGELLKHR